MALAAGRLDLNIFNMRSVIRKPPTILLVAATTAMNPKTKDSVLLCSPTSTIAPTTAIASSAFVSDISGVCSNGETRRITSKPMNPASTKIKSALIRVELLFIVLSLRIRSKSSLEIMVRSAHSIGLCVIPVSYFASAGSLRNSRTRACDNLATVRQQRLAHNVVFEIQIHFLILDQMRKKRSDVARDTSCSQ